jgi:hypothetical protein
MYPLQIAAPTAARCGSSRLRESAAVWVAGRPPRRIPRKIRQPMLDPQYESDRVIVAEKGMIRDSLSARRFCERLVGTFSLFYEGA